MLEGDVVISKSGQYYINLADSGANLPVYATSPITDYDIKKLNTGDYLIGQGDVKNTSAIFESIDFVKLQNLIGIWENKTDGILVNIISSTQLSISSTKTNRKFSANFVYVIAPNEKSKWTLFIFPVPSSPDSKIIPAIVTYNNPTSAKFLRLVLYDPDTHYIQIQSTLFLRNKN